MRLHLDGVVGAVVVLVHRLQPARVVVRVAHDVDIARAIPPGPCSATHGQLLIMTRIRRHAWCASAAAGRCRRAAGIPCSSTIDQSVSAPARRGVVDSVCRRAAGTPEERAQQYVDPHDTRHLQSRSIVQHRRFCMPRSRDRLQLAMCKLPESTSLLKCRMLSHSASSDHTQAH